MNIFQYFEASGSPIYTDFENQITYFHRDGGAEIVPWDRSYKRWIGYSLLNFKPTPRPGVPLHLASQAQLASISRRLNPTKEEAKKLMAEGKYVAPYGGRIGNSSESQSLNQILKNAIAESKLSRG